MSASDNKALLASALEDIVAHNEVLWTRFRYNLQQLSEKNAVLTGLLKEAVTV